MKSCSAAVVMSTNRPPIDSASVSASAKFIAASVARYSLPPYSTTSDPIAAPSATIGATDSLKEMSSESISASVAPPSSGNPSIAATCGATLSPIVMSNR